MSKMLDFFGPDSFTYRFYETSRKMTAFRLIKADVDLSILFSDKSS